MRLILLGALVTLTSCATAPAKDALKSLGGVPAVPRMSSTTVAGFTLSEYSSRSCPTKMSEDASVSDEIKAASACMSHGQWNQVTEFGNRMAVHYSSDPWGAYFLSLAAEHSKDWPRARWMAELAVKKSPNEGIVLYQLGRVEWAMGEMHIAYETLKKAADENPTLVEANVLAGQLALKTDSNSDALKYFHHALEHDSKHFEALMGMAEAEMRKSNWTSAEEHLRTAIQLHPRDTHARITWAEGFEFVAKDNAAALEIYRTIQKLDREHKLDSPLTIDVAAKVQILQASVAEELKKKLSSRTPSGQGQEVSK